MKAAGLMVLLGLGFSQCPDITSAAAQKRQEPSKKVSNLSQQSSKDTSVEKSERDLGYTEQALDPTVVKLPPGYKGNSILLLYETLTKLRLQKDEFETSKQYVERIRLAVG